MKADVSIKIVEATIEKLKKLDLDSGLVADLEWCLGSYKYDKQPSGLIEKCGEALYLLKEAKSKNSRLVSQKLIDDLEKIK